MHTRGSTLARSLLLGSTLVSASAAADEYNFTLLADHSAAAVNMWCAAGLTGTWKGDYDQATNPGGTRTITGLLFGDTKAPKNDPINFNASAVASISSTTHPVGAFRAAINTDLGVMIINDLSADALNTKSIDMNFTLNLAWDAFRTFSPTAYYFGGINLPLPLGSVSLTEMKMEQAKINGVGIPGVGVLHKTQENVYEFTVGVAVNMTVSAAVNGGSIGQATVPFPVVLQGTMFVDPETKSATLVSFTLAQYSDKLSTSFNLPADMPLAIPTILPPGQTANLLASPVFNGVSLDFASGLTLVAWGQRKCNCDLNNDTLVTLEDYFAFFNAFDAGEPLADMNVDGQVSLEDFFAFFNALDEGCD